MNINLNGVTTGNVQVSPAGEGIQFYLVTKNEEHLIEAEQVVALMAMRSAQAEGHASVAQPKE